MTIVVVIFLVTEDVSFPEEKFIKINPVSFLKHRDIGVTLALFQLLQVPFLCRQEATSLLEGAPLPTLSACGASSWA